MSHKTFEEGDPDSRHFDSGLVGSALWRLSRAVQVVCSKNCARALGILMLQDLSPPCNHSSISLIGFVY